MKRFAFKKSAFTLVELVVVIVIIVVMIGFLGYFILVQVPFYLLFGWIWGLSRLVVGLAHEPAAVAFGIAAFFLMPLFFHVAIAPVVKRRNIAWRFRKSFTVSVLIVLIAGAGITMVAGIHEVLWLFGGKEPFAKNVGGSGGAMRRMISVNNLKQLGIGIHSYNDVYEVLPSGGTILEDGRLGIAA